VMAEGVSYHDVHLQDHPARRGVWRAIADSLAHWVPVEGSVLEIGAGHCHWINSVRARRRLAVDRWEGIERLAAPGVETRVLDVSRDLRTLTEYFDTVLASNLLEHFEPDTAADVAGDVATVLKPEGRFIIIQPNFRYSYRSYFDDYTHRSVFTDVSLPNLLRTKGLRIELVRPRFLPYSMRSAQTSIPGWLVRAYLASPIKPLAGQMLVIARRP
jgi:SAM-dependent methyltransferase